jgi:glycosyltransferase involved in cell wall biosynthesis
MSKKSIYYPYPRRKWESDLVNNSFNNFDMLPKSDIKYDGYVDFTNSRGIKHELKKIKLIKKLLFMKNQIKNKYVKLPKYKVNEIDKYDAVITTQLFLNNSEKHKKPYICYVENSHSILDYDYKKYNDEKHSSKIKEQIVNAVQDKYFKGFVFYSERSKLGFYEFYKDIISINYKFLDVIYPFIKDNQYINKSYVIEKSKNLLKNKIKLLYISSMFSLKGGCEIIEAYKILKDMFNLELLIVTNKQTIPNKYKEYIYSNHDIKVFDNNLNNDDLVKLYAESHILLHPTFMDSTAIVIMEALKSGLPVIATDTFAIPEYIENNKNGFIIENPIKMWDLNYKINEPCDFFGGKETARLLDKYKSNTLYEYMINNLVEYIGSIINNYEKFSINVYNNAMESDFSEKQIYEKWNNVIINNLLSS